MNEKYWPEIFKFPSSQDSHIKIVSYNVNSLRAAVLKGILNYLKAEDADIVCIQETKLNDEKLTELDVLKYPFSYSSYCTVKRGYSGVAVLSKIKPEKVNTTSDEEGRIIRLLFNNIVLYNCYAPNVGTGRMEYRENWQGRLLRRIKREKKPVLIVGDLNVCHNPIDLHFPMEGIPCYTDMERQCFRDMLKIGFKDIFRTLQEKENGYSLWSYRAGNYSKNKGMRLDYFLISEEVFSKVKKCEVRSDVYGASDHVPVVLEIENFLNKK